MFLGVGERGEGKRCEGKREVGRDEFVDVCDCGVGYVFFLVSLLRGGGVCDWMDLFLVREVC